MHKLGGKAQSGPSRPLPIAQFWALPCPSWEPSNIPQEAGGTGGALTLLTCSRCPGTALLPEPTGLRTTDRGEYWCMPQLSQVHDELIFKYFLVKVYALGLRPPLSESRAGGGTADVGSPGSTKIKLGAGLPSSPHFPVLRTPRPGVLNIPLTRGLCNISVFLSIKRR